MMSSSFGLAASKLIDYKICDSLKLILFSNSFEWFFRVGLGIMGNSLIYDDLISSLNYYMSLSVSTISFNFLIADSYANL